MRPPGESPAPQLRVPIPMKRVEAESFSRHIGPRLGRLPAVFGRLLESNFGFGIGLLLTLAIQLALFWVIGPLL